MCVGAAYHWLDVECTTIPTLPMDTGVSVFHSYQRVSVGRVRLHRCMMSALLTRGEHTCMALNVSLYILMSDERMMKPALAGRARLHAAVCQGTCAPSMCIVWP